MTGFDSYYSHFIRDFPYTRHLRSYKTGIIPNAQVIYKGKKLIDFSSSDYLGLSKHPLLIERCHEFTKSWGTGSGSSRLVRGNLDVYEELETRLAQVLGKETALILGTGFQANASILEALLDEKVLKNRPLVFCDKACHASVYTGLARLKKFYRFHHNDLYHLQALLDKYADSAQPKFIIAESVYSMEGDQSDLARLSELAEQYQALLYIDDAHAVGIYGPSGWGKAAQFSPAIDLIIGTFSKALGSFGAYLGCSQTVRTYLIHRCKGLIYSTALPPPVLGAISAALDLIPVLDEQRQKIKLFADELRKFLDREQLSYGCSNTPIVPWITGSAKNTRLAAQLFEEEGILVTPIQYPSVAPNKNRLRFCMSALHSENDLQLLFSSIQKVKDKLNICTNFHDKI